MLLGSAPTGYAPDRVIFVAKAGGDVDSIAAAITLVNGLSPVPSVAAPAAILVYPGVYTTAPFTLPLYVSLIGVGKEQTVTLEASTATSALCIANGGQRVEGLTLNGADGVGGIGLDIGSATAAVQVNHLRIIDCTTGMRVNGAGRVLYLQDCGIFGADDGLLVENGGEVNIDGLWLFTSTNGIRIASTNGKVFGGAYRVEDDAGFTYHVQVQGTSSELSLSASIFSEEKTSYVPGAEINVHHMSLVPGDESLQVQAELHVGSESDPRESAFGGGDSHSRRTAYLTNTNLEVGTWADITIQLKTGDASSANLFAAVAVGNCFYVGADQQFPGLKVIMTTARVGGALLLEYWNGSTWVSIPHLSSQADAPYNQYAQRVFLRVQDEQIRFGAITGWATKSLNGITKYWVRYRVTTALTTIPAADRVKVHTNRTEINKDGVVEYFGAAEPTRPLLWHRSLMEELSGYAQPSSTIPIATDFSIAGINNRYADGAKDGSATLLQAIPGLDTSKSLLYEVGFITESSDTGNIEMQLDIVRVASGATLGALPYVAQLSDIVTGPFTLNQLRVAQFQFVVPNLEQDGNLAIALYRDASGGNLDDTFSGAAVHIYSRVLGTFWR
jgi:hypothetical protein